MIVRPATPEDAAGIARVHVESSEDAYAPLAAAWEPSDVAARTHDWEEWLTVGRGDPKRLDRVAEVGDEIVGFVTIGSSRAEVAELEVYVIHVLPEHRGRGVGGRLWSEACDAGRGAALPSMYVRTFAELRCCAFYEARGGQRVASEPTTFFGGAVTEVMYRWEAGLGHELR